MEKLKAFLKNEIVLCVSFALAAASCFFVPPDADYRGYIDWRTLALLYCLMVTVAGLRKAGVFTAMAHGLCVRAKNSRSMGLVLVLLCFFSSMFITNDVALLTFVPFTAVVLGMAGERDEMLLVTVLQTVAANLGSMLMPVGNPQNIYLFSYYHMSANEFFCATVPICAVSLGAVALMCLALPKERLDVNFGEKPGVDGKALALAVVMLVLCLLTVFRLVPWYVLLPVVLILLAIFDRRLLTKADFLLLLTFVCFFVFAGNMGRIEAVDKLIRAAVGGHELLAGAAVSQVISNVPAAVLLSGFTDNGTALLLGTDIGGLGTPVASLASLISLRLYAKTDNARMGQYLKMFLAINFALLAVLLIIGRYVVG